MMKFCLILLLCASSTFIILDGGIFGYSSSVLSERGRLLQAQKPCPVNFYKFQNYTIFTSKCNPRSLPDLCCPALKEFMCPFTQYLHESYDCVSTMWDYINLYGGYSPDRFARVCRGPIQDLECPVPLPPASSSSQSDNANNSNTIPPAGSSQSDKAPNSSNTITVLSGFLPLLLMLPIAALQFIIIM